MTQQRGFTLLELMVAMAIFAMLAVAGWQVFDSVNRARERAQYHADNLAVLQYAYLQLQQDMGQIIAYQAPAVQNNNSSGANNPSSNQTSPSAAEPFMSLNGEHVSFVRFADPDPRYQNSPSVQRIEYILADERLIRRQYTRIQGGRDSISLDTVLLEGVSAGLWQAYLPELSVTFPHSDSQNGQSNSNNAIGQLNNPAVSNAKTMLLPKGISFSFTYQEIPIIWQWALTPQAISHNSSGQSNSIANSDVNNSTDNSNNNDGNNRSINSENNTDTNLKSAAIN
ncbi:type II secretion system minor pseudopilin GspJ [Psychrobacter urativorans]|uniref:type II secretion system minor pseudopilin GspJ n=1 Tax=Psychrobacter urativorans TaxID=45610 RepID=UPI001919DD70|nr:type II secretion system minor pseudopilin GspJ [Psychrobacter urativorans]